MIMQSCNFSKKKKMENQNIMNWIPIDSRLTCITCHSFIINENNSMISSNFKESSKHIALSNSLWSKCFNILKFLCHESRKNIEKVSKTIKLYDVSTEG